MKKKPVVSWISTDDPSLPHGIVPEPVDLRAEKMKKVKKDQYHPAYCQMMIDYCAGGYSITGFAGKIGRSRESLQNWAVRYPEFGEAIRKAKAAAAVWWEAKQREAMAGGASPSVLSTISNQLRNLASMDLQDKVVIDKTTRTSSVIVHTQATPRQALEAYKASLRGDDGDVIEGEAVEVEDEVDDD